MRPERAAFFDQIFRQLEQGLATQALKRRASTKLSPLAFDRNLSAEQTQYLSVLGEFDQINAFRVLTAARLIKDADDTGGLRIKASEATEQIEDLRQHPDRAACLSPLKIALAPGWYCGRREHRKPGWRIARASPAS